MKRVIRAKKPVAADVPAAPPSADPVIVEGMALDLRKLNTLLLGFIALIGMVFVLMQLFEVLLPVILALLISLICKPVLHTLRRRRVPMGVAIVLVLLLVAAVLGGVSLVIMGGIQGMVDAAPRYQANLNALFSSGVTWLDGILQKFGKRVDLSLITDSLQVSSVTGFLAASAGSALTVLANFVLTLLVLVFLLMGSESLPRKIHRAFSTEGSARVSSILRQVDTQVRRYLVTKTVVNLIVAAVTAVILLSFGVDFALFAAGLTFFLHYIPTVGSLVATLFPALISLLQFQSVGLTSIIVVLLVAVHNFIGNFVEPKMMGANLDLSPLVVLVSLIFWGWVWGAWGMVLAVPITSIIKIICENVGALQPLALLMSAGAPEDPSPLK